MKKFVGVFDGFRFSKSTLQYAIQLAQVSGAHLVGSFLDEFIYRSYDLYNVLKNSKDPYKAIQQLDESDKQKRNQAVAQFEQACAKNGVQYSIHRDRSIALQELKHESMFADLVIIDSGETFNKRRENLPTTFIKELLADVQSPVLLVPRTFKKIDKIVMLYDGAPSSVFAIKMFSYMFNNLMGLPVEVLTVKGADQGNHVPHNKLMKEFIKRHYPKATYTVLKGDAEEQIVSHLQHRKQNELVVLGAYRRSEISRWFKTSMADVLMKAVDTPLFIAHNK